MYTQHSRTLFPRHLAALTFPNPFPPEAPLPSKVKSRLATPRRRSRIRLLLRAILRHLLALLREFRGPLLGFVAATVLGGFIYGEIYQIVRGEHIALVDRPYIMLQLMLIEAPEDVPSELSLVAFWYLMPAVFILLVGLGAADFLDLFFNREEHRDRWGEALAMTFRNHAIVLGAGHVGLRVVRDLHDMGLEIAVIDLDPHVRAKETLERFSVPIVMGDGRTSTTLNNAGLDKAEVFIACTGDDRVNLEAVMKVRELRPGVRVVARVWDRGMGDRMEQFGMVDTVMSAADLSAPAFAGAALGIEITQTIQLKGEEYSTVRLTVESGSFLDGALVGPLESNEKMEVVLVGSGDGSVTVDPGPEATIQAGDDIVIFAQHSRVLDAVTRNRKGRR